MDAVGVTAVELGQELGVAAQSIRQARLDPSSPGYRSPPAGWQEVLIRMAQERCVELKRVVGLRGDGAGGAEP